MIPDIDPSTIIVGASELLAIVEEMKYSPPGLVIFLSGGCVRDQLHDLPPNDIDIAVLQSDEESRQTILDTLEQLGWEMVEIFDRDATSSYTKQFPDEEDRFDEIIKYEHPDSEHGLDLLFYKEKYDTVASVMGSHDHTINQFAAWYTPDKQLKAGYFGERPEDYGFCYQIRTGLSGERIHRVKQICRNLGWVYVGDL